MSDENELKNIANPIGVDTSAWSPAADVNPAVPAWLIPNKLYDILKWLAALVFPALALFMGTVGPAWGLPYVDAIVTTLNALGVLAGAERVHLERDRISLPNRIRDAHLALSGQPGVNDRMSDQASHVGR